MNHPGLILSVALNDKDIKALFDFEAAVRAAALEKAAKACDSKVDSHPGSIEDTIYKQAVEHCAAAIRAMKE